MKRRMMVLVMITVLAASSPVMVACQTEECAANQEAATSSSSSMGGLETFTTVAAWGDNFFGQLGNGVPLPYPADSSTPVEVKDPNDPSGYLSGVKALTAGSSHSLALKDDGTIWAWGNNWFGQLATGTTTDGTQTTCEVTMIGGRTSSSCPDSNTPVQMSEVGGIEAIAAGGAHGLALKDDGTVWAWGMNQDSQLGNGTYTLGTSTPGVNTPVQVSNLSTVKAIAGGGLHSLAGW